MQIIENNEEDLLLSEVADHFQKTGIRQKVKTRVDKLEQTCIDTDDDDLEFDDAQEEEEEDIMVHDRSAFLVSKTNVSRYQEAKSVMYNKILSC